MASLLGIGQKLARSGEVRGLRGGGPGTDGIYKLQAYKYVTLTIRSHDDSL